MPTAKRLPSGTWRVLVYSHSENGKRIYKSFTSQDKSRRGKAEAEEAAAAFIANHTPCQRKQIHNLGLMTLGEAVDMYISEKKTQGLSPKTLEGYEIIRKNAFPDLMKMQLKNIDEDALNNAIAAERNRTHNRWKGNSRKITPKCIHNEYGLVSSVLHRYWPHINFYAIKLPQLEERNVELPPVSDVMDLVRGTSIELPVLLAMWLSFSLSEIRGLTKSGSITRDGNYIRINQVVVDVYSKPVTKPDAKNDARKRMHRIPPYIKGLIDALPPEQDALVAISGQALSARWSALQRKSAWWDPITFHDLRHMNASVMALLKIPDKYAQERGGWKTDKVMKKIYMTTFSDERIKVDNLIDGYMNEQLNHAKKDVENG